MGGDMTMYVSAETCSGECGDAHTYAINTAHAMGLTASDVPDMWAGACAMATGGGGGGGGGAPDTPAPTQPPAVTPEDFCMGLAMSADGGNTEIMAECMTAMTGGNSLLSGAACGEAANGNLILVLSEVSTICGGGGATDDGLTGFSMTPRDDFVQCAIDGGLDVPSLSAPVHCCIELLMANELPATCLGTDDEGFCLPADGTCPFAPPDMPLPGLVFTTSNCQMLLGMDATAQEMVAFCGVTDLVELCNAMPLFMGPNACWDGLCTTYCDGTGGCP